MLQQAIGGIEGEMRVCLQYLFQAWNSRGPAKYRDMLLDVGTEKIVHIEMLATAVALTLEGAPLSVAEDAIKQDGMVGAGLGGMNPRSFLSAGLGAMAMDAEGVPLGGAYVVGSGNILADMYTNVAAESTGRALATRLWETTDDPGMKETPLAKPPRGCLTHWQATEAPTSHLWAAGTSGLYPTSWAAEPVHWAGGDKFEFFAA